MPEFPDVTVYVERLEAMLGGHILEGVRLKSPFLLRTVEPPVQELEGKRMVGCRRIGKRLVLEFEPELFMVIHLMIAGRLRLRDRGAKVPGKVGLAAFDFDHGTLLFTEAGTKKRASLYVVRGEANLEPFHRGGVDVFAIDAAEFAELMRRENHTLKRSLTDPRIIDGVGNAYSDEILHRAKLSPLKLTQSLPDEALHRLHAACREVLTEWLERLRAEVGNGFPEKVTAFHEAMAVHGRYGKPCPTCGQKVQRIRYADNETNYCAQCQNEGRLLADRALSRLLKKDWPKSLAELEELKAGLR